MSTNADPKTMLAQIRQNTEASSQPTRKRASRKARPEALGREQEQPAGAPASGGRPVAFWVNDEVRGLLKEIGRMLWENDIKPSDSLIIWSALSSARNDPRLIEIAKQLRERDGRKRRRREADPCVTPE